MNASIKSFEYVDIPLRKGIDDEIIELLEKIHPNMKSPILVKMAEQARKKHNFDLRTIIYTVSKGESLSGDNNGAVAVRIRLRLCYNTNPELASLWANTHRGIKGKIFLALIQDTYRDLLNGEGLLHENIPGMTPYIHDEDVEPESGSHEEGVSDNNDDDLIFEDNNSDIVSDLLSSIDEWN